MVRSPARRSGESRYIAESSDTESADVRPKETKRRLPSIQLTSSFFKKKQDKAASEHEPTVRHIDPDDDDAETVTAEDQANEAEGNNKPDATELARDTTKLAKDATGLAKDTTGLAKDTTKLAKDAKAKDKGLVYAELDLVRSSSPTMVPVVKNDDEKTEYAEIVYTPAKDGGDDVNKGK